MLAAVPQQAEGGRVLRYLLLTAQARNFHQQHGVGRRGSHIHHVRSDLAPSPRMLSIKLYGLLQHGENRSSRGGEQVSAAEGTELGLTLLVLQGVHGLLILILEHLDKAVWHDFATPIFTHLSHDNVV